MSGRDGVGPVLETGDSARAVAEAIRKLNPQAEILDRGSYLRIRSPLRCVLTRQAVEECLGLPFRLPGDLELIMPAFKGYLTITSDEAVWNFSREP